MSLPPASKGPPAWLRFLPLKTRIFMGQKLIGYGNSLAEWIAPEWFEAERAERMSPVPLEKENSE